MSHGDMVPLQVTLYQKLALHWSFSMLKVSITTTVCAQEGQPTARIDSTG